MKEHICQLTSSDVTEESYALRKFYLNSFTSSEVSVSSKLAVAIRGIKFDSKFSKEHVNVNEVISEKD